jgi:hypothetical protein
LAILAGFAAQAPSMSETLFHVSAASGDAKAIATTIKPIFLTECSSPSMVVLPASNGPEMNCRRPWFSDLPSRVYHSRPVPG